MFASTAGHSLVTLFVSPNQPGLTVEQVAAEVGNADVPGVSGLVAERIQGNLPGDLALLVIVRRGEAEAHFSGGRGKHGKVGDILEGGRSDKEWVTSKLETTNIQHLPSSTGQ